MPSAAAILALLLAPAQPAHAQQASYLPVTEAVAALADGRPWAGTRPDGGQVRLTLQPNGTGRFEGPVTRAITWSVQGQEICIAIGLPVGTRCLRFLRHGPGFAAHEAGEPAFTLSR
jgi:hypothetical protein